MAALLYADEPGYSAVLFRRNLTMLAEEGGLIPLSQEWLAGTGAVWQQQKARWRFPAGGVLAFGYLDGPRDREKYQGARYDYIGFDEVTQIREADYRYLFSRLRRSTASQIPLRVRSSANPGGVGHEWVKRRFVDGGSKFYPSKMADNPGLDVRAYRESLAELDPITRAQLEHGDWDIRPDGGLFKREWIRFTDVPAPAQARRVRAWDLAATAPTPGRDPDWTVGVRLAEHRGVWTVEHVVRHRLSPAGVEALIRSTAEQDGREIRVVIEREGGASGKLIADHYGRSVLSGWNYRAVPKRQDKVSMAGPVASAAENGLLLLAPGEWRAALVDELVGFPQVAHDDQVDALSLAMSDLAPNRGKPRAAAFGAQFVEA